MRLVGKVQFAKVDDYRSGLEVTVLDREEVGMMNKRPQYSCKVVGGWMGLDELRDLKKNGASEQEIENFAAQIQLPQEDEVLVLRVKDITGKMPYHRLVCVVEATV